MPDLTPNLSLPYLLPSQAQKHVTHNEALRHLDTLVQLAVQNIGATTPPAAPADGEAHALGASPTGAWAGQGGRLAVYSENAWVFLTPQKGWRAWDMSENVLRVYMSGTWAPVVPELENLSGLGVGATSDATNRLALASDAALFSHAGTDHRLTINKASSTDTASVVYQSNWSGRAEMGLTGSEDFQIRVSPDGNTFVDALSARRSDGAIQVPSLFSGTLEIANNGVGYLPTPAPGGMVAINLVNGDFPQARHSGLFAFDTGASLQLHSLAAGPEMDNLNDAVLSGTTGTDGHSSIAVRTGELQIENRFSGTRRFAYTFLNAY